MHTTIEAFQKQLEDEGVAPEYTHRMAGDIQMQYLDSLVAASGSGVDPIPQWRGVMYKSNGLNKQMHPEDYRDHWEDDDVANTAVEDLREVWRRLQQQQQGSVGEMSGEGALRGGVEPPPAAAAVAPSVAVASAGS
jgi:hypothetical protein